MFNQKLINLTLRKAKWTCKRGRREYQVLQTNLMWTKRNTRVFFLLQIIEFLNSYEILQFASHKKDVNYYCLAYPLCFRIYIFFIFFLTMQVYISYKLVSVLTILGVSQSRTRVSRDNKG